MTSYKVFEHQKKSLKIVKVGFAWLAPLNPIWPLFRGLWLVFVSYIFVSRLTTNKSQRDCVR